MSPEGDFVIEPLTRGNMNWVISYYRRDNLEPSFFTCHVVTKKLPLPTGPHAAVLQTLKTYRLAINTTGE